MVVLHRCHFCERSLLCLDYIGQPISLMDRAIACHVAGECTGRTAAAVSALGTLPAPLVPSAIWPEDDPPLVHCARHGLTQTALHLLAIGITHWVPIGACARDGMTALHLAAAQNNEQLCLALIDAGADVCAMSANTEAAGELGGQLPLHLAAVRGSEAAIDILLAVGTRAADAQLTTHDSEEWLPAGAAWLAGHTELAARLVGATRTALSHMDESEDTARVSESLDEIGSEARQR